MKKFYFLLLAGVMCSCQQKANQSEPAPQWLEADSAKAIESRIDRDYSLTFEEGAAKIIEAHPELNVDSVREFAKRHLVEVRTINGQERMFRKSPRNLDLLNPAYSGEWTNRGATASPARHAYADSVLKCLDGKMADGGAHRVRVRFNVDVPYHPELEGDTLRVWMPFPAEADRQSDIELISTGQPDYVISTPDQSVHTSLYMEQPVSPDGNHFEYVAEFTGKGAYVAPEYIQKHMKPYDKEGDIYRKYTAMQAPHIVALDSLAHAIVGDETNPLKQSQLVFDYIIKKYPWAGAREYSTIPCIPEYVLEEGHGDCGQVSLLYISLMRTLGVPTRWESGWMLHPGEKNLHDWAETYYEGIGWVPVDVSFGRMTNNNNPRIRDFYNTGIDAHRLIANKGVNSPFFPAKKYVRSETVDAQMGEVECSKGNLFYPAWDMTLEILSQTPINQ